MGRQTDWLTEPLGRFSLSFLPGRLATPFSLALLSQLLKSEKLNQIAGWDGMEG